MPAVYMIKISSKFVRKSNNYMKRALFTLLWVLPFLSIAQSNFKRGYVVTNSKDTLRGYVDYKEHDLSPSSVKFRSSEGGNFKIFVPKDCAGYGIDGHEYYKTYVVNISNSADNISQLNDRLDSTSRRDTVFLKVLQSGKKIVLFSYEDKIKERYYFLSEGESEPIELIKTLYLKPGGSGAVISGNKFRQQLLIAMRKSNNGISPEEEQLEQLKYRELDLLKVISSINGEKIIKHKISGLRLFAGVGLNMSKGSYKGDNVLAGDKARVKTSYLPMVSGGVDVLANQSIGKLIYRFELALLIAKSDIASESGVFSKIKKRHSFDQYSIALVPQLIYNAYNGNKLKVFFSGGPGFNFSTYKNNRTVTISDQSGTTEYENEIVLEKFNFSVQLKVGVVLNKKIECSVGYIPSTAISDYSRYNVVMQRYTVGINYLFGKH